MSDKDREAFEAHTKTLPLPPDETYENLLRRRANGNYFDKTIYAAYEGWKAARDHYLP